MTSGRAIPARTFWKDTLAPILGMEDQKGIVSLSLHIDPRGPVVIKTEQYLLDDAGLAQRKIIQKDRFATYEPKDMWWAEPLGLAEWGNDVQRANKTYRVVEC